MKIKLLTILLTLMAVLPSCSHDGDDTTLDPNGEDAYTISFQMVTSATQEGSRADSQHVETGSEYESFEDGIDINNLAIFIFGRTAGTTDAETLIYKTTDVISSKHVTVDGAPGSYVVNIVLSQGEFENKLGYEISPNDTRNIALRMLVLANCVGKDQNQESEWSAVNGEDFATVTRQLADWSYGAGNLYKSSATGNDVTDLYGPFMPMYGTNVVVVSQQALYDSRPGHPVWLDDIHMLRSVAKIRVVDNIDKNNDGYPRIVSAEFVGSQSVIKQLPYNADIYQNGQQVHTPNIYADGMLSTVNPSVYRLGTIRDSWANVPTSERKGNEMIAFVPEQKIGLADNNIDSWMPMLRIRVAVYKDHVGKDVEKAYQIKLKPYNDEQYTTLCTSLLRNHIYTVSVTEVAETSLDCTVDLVPYRGCDLNPYFGL